MVHRSVAQINVGSAVAMNNRPKVTVKLVICSVLAFLFAAIALFERVVGWMSGAAAEDITRAADNVRTWYESIPHVAETWFQNLMTVMSLLAIIGAVVCLWCLYKMGKTPVEQKTTACNDEELAQYTELTERTIETRAQAKTWRDDVLLALGFYGHSRTKRDFDKITQLLERGFRQKAIENGKKALRAFRDRRSKNMP